MTYGQWHKESALRGMSKNGFDKARLALIERGMVVKRDDGYSRAA